MEWHQIFVELGIPILDQEYWIAVGRQVVGCLEPGTYEAFIEWLGGSEDRLTRYAKGEQERMNLILEFQRGRYESRT